MRDISQRTFEKKCKAFGFSTVGFMGYWQIGNVHMSVLNYPKRRDAFHAFMAEWDRQQKDREVTK